MIGERQHIPELWVSGRRLFSSSERFVLIMAISLVTHIVLLLGISFVVPTINLSPPPVMKLDVVLVNNPSTNIKPPEEAELLAEQSQSGGGMSEVESRQPPNPASEAEEGVLLNDPLYVTASKTKQTQNPPILAALGEKDRVSDNAADKEVDAEFNSDNEEGDAPQTIWVSQETPAWADSRTYPRQEYLTAATRESEYAAYMAAWRNHVESVGNRYFPGWVGELVMDVAVRADGSVHSITVVRSSGNRSLDRAAVEIVNLSAPFMPFPPAFSNELDLLHLTRTWRFTNDQGLRSE